MIDTKTNYRTDSGQIELFMQGIGIVRLKNGYGDGKFSIEIVKHGGNYGEPIAEYVVAKDGQVCIEGLDLPKGTNTLYAKDGNIMIHNEPWTHSDKEVLDLYELLDTGWNDKEE